MTDPLPPARLAGSATLGEVWESGYREMRDALVKLLAEMEYEGIPFNFALRRAHREAKAAVQRWTVDNGDDQVVEASIICGASLFVPISDGFARLTIECELEDRHPGQHYGRWRW